MRPSSIARRWPGRCASPPQNSARSRPRSPMPAIARSGSSSKFSKSSPRWRWIQRRFARRRACLCAARCRDRAGKARGRRQLRAPRGRSIARLCDRGRPASRGRAGAQARRPAIHRECLRSLARAVAKVRPDLADHRPQHGGQIDLPAPERADHAAGADRLVRAGDAGADRHRRPAVLPRRRRR